MKFHLGCVCFGWKSLLEMLFWKWDCLVGLKNSIFWKLKSVDWKKKPLTTEIILHFYFPFKVFPENERERDRETERARDRDRTRSRNRIEIAIAPNRHRTGSRSHRISQSDRDCDRTGSRDQIEIAIAPDRECRRRNLAKIAISPSLDRDRRRGLGYGLCFFEFVFSFFFSKHQKIFFGKFFETQPNTMETFSFSGN